MSITITLNDYDINSSTNNVFVRSLGLDNAPAININDLEIAREDGRKIISLSYEPKEITIAGVIKGSSRSSLETNIDNFKKNCFTAGEMDLVVDYAGSSRTYKVVAKAVQVGSETGGRDFYQNNFAPFSITLVASDPPFGEDNNYSSAHSVDNIIVSAHSADITFDGSAPPVPLIRYEINTAGSLKKIITKNDTTNRQLEVSTNWINGDVLDIDTENKLCLRNDETIGFEGVFPEFELGENAFRSIFLKVDDITSEQTKTDGNQSFHGHFPPRSQLAQRFLCDATTTYPMVELSLASHRKIGEPGDFILEIQGDNAGIPDGTPITNSTININSQSLPSYHNFSWITFRFSEPISLNVGVYYWIVLRGPNMTKHRYGIHWQSYSGNAYSNGYASIYRNGSWSNLTTTDMCFRVYRTPASVDWSIDNQIRYKKRWL